MSAIAPAPPYGAPDPSVPSHVGQSATASAGGIPTANCAVCAETLYEGMRVTGYLRTGDDVRDIAVACETCSDRLDVPKTDAARYEVFSGSLVPNTVFTGFEYLYVDTTV
ncbi:hypothetical protein [Halogranum rubrum]|uniref:Uncharacterized protein n=1 Tax=Halogranum salarium B-1 TaxID=1210908 RepID=J2ZBF4_9EURY|nr:hypothetical protein [Halogranum salarium]EJN57990.1 hypothetical protein HSB1_34070 [Halogranum salarium B-1]